jgi:hypothetical protein
VVFQTEHLKRILAAAEAGENARSQGLRRVRDRRKVLCGNDNLYRPPDRRSALEKAVHIQNSITSGAGRSPSAISDPAKRTTRQLTLSFDLYENGISRALRLDYGDFVLGNV